MTINYNPSSKIIQRQIKQQHELGLAIIPFLIDRYHPESIVEFGCGVGRFLMAFVKAANIDPYNYIGYDGTDYLKNSQIPNFNFCKINFIKLSDKANFIKFDMVVSLEVAEHLPIEYADKFIGLLTGHAKKTILFSAAQVNQGGDGHVNENSLEYWEQKFNQQGFKKIDILRSMIKNNKAVPFWYRNNIFIYERS
jgi:2-polyprenyl-3-methyl-5-hydroxy-6-metoxy-1,4-benzoquinol methylase